MKVKLEPIMFKLPDTAEWRIYKNPDLWKNLSGSNYTEVSSNTKDCHLMTPKTEQCFCQSYMNDDNILVDCTCGKCEIAGKYPKEEVPDCFTCPHCCGTIYYKSKNE
jgi:hypothetical protein